MSAAKKTIPRGVYARHLASKMATDLGRLQRVIGDGVPRDEVIDGLVAEAAVLLEHGCLGEATYGFLRDGKWRYAVRFCVDGGAEDGAARAMHEGEFCSVLVFSARWAQLPQKEKDAVGILLPVARANCRPPAIEKGYWLDDHCYQSGGLSVQRAMIDGRQ